MSYLYLLAGDNLELSMAELEGFMESQGLGEEFLSRTGRLVESKSETKQLKRLALTHEVSTKESELENAEDSLDLKVEGSFSVEAENLTDKEINTKTIEEKVGESLLGEKNQVDLDNPETVFKAYVTSEKIFIGRLEENINRGLFKKRRNQERPFSSPISLDPVLARVLVNLSGLSNGEKILDPFCGTGGILIEAGLCGIGVYGFDLQKEMIEGCEENLEEYGIITHHLNQLDISQATDKDLEPYDAIVTDLPYGKSSKRTEDVVEDFLELLEGFEGKAVFMYNQEKLGDYKADFSVYVHKNLTRHIYLV